jgi:hypothetical protein
MQNIRLNYNVRFDNYNRASQNNYSIFSHTLIYLFKKNAWAIDYVISLLQQ